MDIFDQIAAGVRPPHPPSARTPADLWRTETELQLSYALAKQVPDMERGFIIATGYGDIVIPAGRAADFIADQVRMALKAELLKLADKAPT